MIKKLAVLWTVVRGDARLMWRALRHPDAPTWFKLGALGVVVYVVSPLDLVPDMIPVLGVLDDVVLVPLAMRFLLKRLPPELRSEIGAASGN